MTALGRRTLRARVSLLTAAAVLVVLLLAAAGLVLAQRATLTRGLDETLVDRADAGVAALRNGLSGLPDVPGDDVVVQVLGADGAVVASSPSGAAALVSPADVPTDGERRTVALAEGDGRLVARQSGDRTVVVAGLLDDVRDSSAALVRALAVGVPLAALVLAALVWWAVGRALRPVEHLRREVEAIGGSDLSRRVAEPEEPEEIGRLARTMNAMLARVQSAGERQRRFVDDASHELRSPLARIRAELEVDRAHPGSADPARTADTLLTETRTMQQLVDDLLLLARADSNGAPDHRRPLDLDGLVEQAAARRRAAGAVVDTTGVRPVQVAGRAAELDRAVGNLLDNAVRHARSRVVVTLTEDPGGTALLTVADDGPGVPDADADRVFERFVRLDAARSAGDGVGLGLAIARDVAERHGGTLALARRDPSSPGARFVLTLPGIHPTG
jgi:signal transduction histidine kinase